jgi:hypothetical protein
VMKSYNTAASRRLKTLEEEFNRGRPAGSPRIVFVDYDQIATWYGMSESPNRLDEAIGQYLEAKTGKKYEAEALTKLAQAMGNLRPAAFTPRAGTGGDCLVVPEYPGMSFDSFYAASFRIGENDPLSGRVVLIQLSTQEFGDFATAHEAWHCFDVRYNDHAGSGLSGATRENKAEMFADLGGVMESIKNGANLTLLDRIAASRASWIYLTGPARAQTSDDHDEHYKSIIYHTHPGLQALKARIQQMGIENFRKLGRAEMRDLAYEIVEGSALTPAQAQGLYAYYETGKAPAAVQGQITQLQAMAKVSVRDATREEIAAQGKTLQVTESALLTALRLRAGELGGASNITNQLKARQEMTDRLRERLSTSPGRQRATEAELNLLFHLDPRLGPKGG